MNWIRSLVEEGETWLPPIEELDSSLLAYYPDLIGRHQHHLAFKTKMRLTPHRRKTTPRTCIWHNLLEVLEAPRPSPTAQGRSSGRRGGLKTPPAAPAQSRFPLPS
ncbi:MAG: hypothetical protein U0694_17940 [Anaerolineae bacterium]